jgi:riboflavin biosynthesis pyrimidine reductase
MTFMPDESPTVEQLVSWYLPPAENFVRSNMVMNTAGDFVVNGHAKDISGPEDMRHLSFIRTMSDAVIVGAETARIDNYRLPKLRPEFAHLATKPPRLVILSRSLEFDRSSEFLNLQDGQETPIFISSPKVDRSWSYRREELATLATVWLVPEINFLSGVVKRLRDNGYHRLLTEGGPAILQEFRCADLIDEYCLTLSPKQSSVDFGEALIRLTGQLAEFELTHSHKASDFLFTKYHRRQA